MELYNGSDGTDQLAPMLIFTVNNCKTKKITSCVLNLARFNSLLPLRLDRVLLSLSTQYTLTENLVLHVRYVLTTL